MEGRAKLEFKPRTSGLFVPASLADAAQAPEKSEKRSRAKRFLSPIWVQAFASVVALVIATVSFVTSNRNYVENRVDQLQREQQGYASKVLFWRESPSENCSDAALPLEPECETKIHVQNRSIAILKVVSLSEFAMLYGPHDNNSLVLLKDILPCSSVDIVIKSNKYLRFLQFFDRNGFWEFSEIQFWPRRGLRDPNMFANLLDVDPMQTSRPLEGCTDSV